MSTDKLMETVKLRSMYKHEKLKTGVSESGRLKKESLERAVKRLESALQPLSSIEELDQYLPPAALYLGPGAWINAIKNSVPIK
ncbi:MAG: hypothetical protein LBQ88_06135 [Treponema sp.]|jgi:hypothetical protein|nr:hypothetical protein [Treponema sp.]